MKPLEHKILSDSTRHTATRITDCSEHQPGRGQDCWTVTWLGPRHLSHGQAMTALALAEAIYLWRDERWRPHIEQWAAVFGLTVDAAMTMIGSRW